MQLQLHYITEHYTTLITLHKITLHYTTTTTATATATTTTLHYTSLHYTNYTTLQLQLHSFTLHCTRLHYTIPHYSTQHYSTLHYLHHTTTTTATATTLHYTSYTTLQLQLKTTTPLQLQLQLHYTTLHPAVVVRWPLQPLQPLQKTQLQPPFGPSVDSLCHPRFTTTNLSYRFPIFETSATALCGTTGIHLTFINIPTYIYIYIPNNLWILITINHILRLKTQKKKHGGLIHTPDPFGSWSRGQKSFGDGLQVGFSSPAITSWL